MLDISNIAVTMILVSMLFDVDEGLYRKYGDSTKGVMLRVFAFYLVATIIKVWWLLW